VSRDHTADAPAPEIVAEAAPLEQFCKAALRAAGGDEPTAEAATAAMMHGSLLGVDSHGVRLLDHYVKAIQGGRVNGRPTLHIRHRLGAVAVLDADDGHGALAAYRATEAAVELAGTHGIGAVSIANSSHFGAAGAYARCAADAGCIGFAVCNSDSFVRLHDGAARFHGTNPIAVAVPVRGQRPWLLDMATSAITYNRIQLHKSRGTPLPEGVASTADGDDTTDPERAEMLAPLGGPFGFKGAGLAGMVEILSAVLSGMRTSSEILPMGGPDFTTPRQMGAYVMALRPDAFGPRETFEAGMRRYLDALRSSPPRSGGTPMAPGDREWAEERRRRQSGIPLDPATATAFQQLAARHRLQLPFRNG
jgi:LDH2 family malate/lactate/ureidoglycolate dehydrogenase